VKRLAIILAIILLAPAATALPFDTDGRVAVIDYDGGVSVSHTYSTIVLRYPHSYGGIVIPFARFSKNTIEDIILRRPAIGFNYTFAAEDDQIIMGLTADVNGRNLSEYTYFYYNFTRNINSIVYSYTMNYYTEKTLEVGKANYTKWSITNNSIVQTLLTPSGLRIYKSNRLWETVYVTRRLPYYLTPTMLKFTKIYARVGGLENNTEASLQLVNLEGIDSGNKKVYAFVNVTKVNSTATLSWLDVYNNVTVTRSVASTPGSLDAELGGRPVFDAVGDYHLTRIRCRVDNATMSDTFNGYETMTYADAIRIALKLPPGYSNNTVVKELAVKAGFVALLNMPDGIRVTVYVGRRLVYDGIPSLHEEDKSVNVHIIGFDPDLLPDTIIIIIHAPLSSFLYMPIQPPVWDYEIPWSLLHPIPAKPSDLTNPYQQLIYGDVYATLNRTVSINNIFPRWIKYRKAESHTSQENITDSIYVYTDFLYQSDIKSCRSAYLSLGNSSPCIINSTGVILNATSTTYYGLFLSGYINQNISIYIYPNSEAYIIIYNFTNINNTNTDVVVHLADSSLRLFFKQTLMKRKIIPLSEGWNNISLHGFFSSIAGGNIFFPVIIDILGKGFIMNYAINSSYEFGTPFPIFNCGGILTIYDYDYNVNKTFNNILYNNYCKKIVIIPPKNISYMNFSFPVNVTVVTRNGTYVVKYPTWLKLRNVSDILYMEVTGLNWTRLGYEVGYANYYFYGGEVLVRTRPARPVEDLVRANVTIGAFTLGLNDSKYMGAGVVEAYIDALVNGTVYRVPLGDVALNDLVNNVTVPVDYVDVNTSRVFNYTAAVYGGIASPADRYMAVTGVNGTIIYVNYSTAADGAACIGCLWSIQANGTFIGAANGTGILYPAWRYNITAIDARGNRLVAPIRTPVGLVRAPAEVLLPATEVTILPMPTENGFQPRATEVRVNVTGRGGVEIVYRIPARIRVSASPGAVSGRLVDYYGEPIPGATVKLARGGRILATAKTGKDGSFAFNGVEPGAYTLVYSGDEDYVGYTARVAVPATAAVPVCPLWLCLLILIVAAATVAAYRRSRRRVEAIYVAYKYIEAFRGRMG